MFSRSLNSWDRIRNKSLQFVGCVFCQSVLVEARTPTVHTHCVDICYLEVKTKKRIAIGSNKFTHALCIGQCAHKEIAAIYLVFRLELRFFSLSLSLFYWSGSFYCVRSGKISDEK